MAYLPEHQVRIEVTGDPEPWDHAFGGDVVYEWPSREHPRGRCVRDDYVVGRARWSPEQCRFLIETRRVPHDAVTLTAMPEPEEPDA